ncbi:MAG: hypothetical protein IJ300_11730 [Clostridia bacterium]|nr:hypothetical protein [Clostridia bacterium]
MPIFTQQLQKVDYSNPHEALKKMYSHIKYIQEQLEYTLMNLDSRNITEIDTDKTVITDSTGGSSIGSYITLTGAKGESFKVGKNADGGFDFSISGKNGVQTLYLDSSGNLVITKNTTLTVDGGEWL